MYLLLDYQINETLFKNIKNKTAISTRRTSLASKVHQNTQAVEQ